MFYTEKTNRAAPAPFVIPPTFINPQRFSTDPSEVQLAAARGFIHGLAGKGLEFMPTEFVRNKLLCQAFTTGVERGTMAAADPGIDDSILTAAIANSTATIHGWIQFCSELDERNWKLNRFPIYIPFLPEPMSPAEQQLWRQKFGPSVSGNQNRPRLANSRSR